MNGNGVAAVMETCVSIKDVRGCSLQFQEDFVMPAGFIGELFGTMILILLGDGVVAGVLLNLSKAQNGGWIVITAGWAFAVLSGAFVSLALGGPASLNPAGIIATIVTGNIAVNDGILLIVAQFIGAFIGAVLVYLHYLPHWRVTDDPSLKLAVFSTGPAIRNPATNLISEIVGTFVLIFVATAIGPTLGALGEGGVASGGGGPANLTNITPFLVGTLVWGIGLSLGGPTGYAINPARDLGPRIAHAILPIPGKGSSDWGYSWIPVVGPIIGGIIAALLFAAFAPGA
jgi:glycerol uptake facilitator protein